VLFWNGLCFIKAGVKMNTADVSLITYTYNDGHFVDGLLADMAGWDVGPKEVVVVDDGSATPYQAPPCAVPVRVIRHDSNLGIPHTKHEAISSAGSQVLLAMDCDTRVVPSWLSMCLPFALKPEVGLVSGPVIYLSGDDLVSRYQRTFGDNHNLGVTGETVFVPGNAFLLRRSVWAASGGLAGFQGEVCEDHFFCNRLREMGLKLWIEDKARACQVRRITRVAMLRRYWKWCHAHVKTQSLETPDIAKYATVVLALPHGERVQTAIAREEPLFIYLEIVFLSYTILDTLDHLEAMGRDTAGLKQAWWNGLKERFARYPALWAFLRMDLSKLGQTEPPALGGEGCAPWESAFETMDALLGSGLYEWLSKAGVASMAAEESSIAYDFSFYEKTEFSARDFHYS
jgi:glycosyltransferase involved in cell wall biosynthesis